MFPRRWSTKDNLSRHLTIRYETELKANLINLRLEEGVVDIPRRSQECQRPYKKLILSSQVKAMWCIPEYGGNVNHLANDRSSL